LPASQAAADDCQQEIVMLSDVAIKADASALADLVNAAYRGTQGRRGWTHETELLSGARATANDVAAMIGGGTTTILIRRQSGSSALLGCVAVEMDGGDRGMISMLAVAPESQNTAVGRALLADAERLAADRGATVAKMTVIRQRDELIAWYERRGYRRTGQSEAFPYGDDSVGTPLRDDLAFVVLQKTL
jgi:ribosomal protein S18 acetylase RimI-like enzyme